MPAIILIKDEIKELKERIRHAHDEREVIHLGNMIRGRENLLITIRERRTRSSAHITRGGNE